MLIRHLLVCALIPLLLLTAAGCKSRRKQVEGPKDYNHELAPGEDALREVDSSELPLVPLTPATRQQLQAAIGHSLSYLEKKTTAQYFPVNGIGHDQVVRSLQALNEMLGRIQDEAAFNAELKRRFRALMSVGCDGQGTVLFTGYCTPILDGSLKPDSTYRYPLYRKPADLVPGKGDEPAQQLLANGSLHPYPSREELERSGALRGLELVYLKDPFDAYIVLVQGSGKIRLPGGEIMEVGFSGTNNHKYHSINKDLVADGKIPATAINLATMRAYFQSHPADLPIYTARNPRYIFFAKVVGGPFGCLNEKVTTNVTVATDKSIFPRAAPTLVRTLLYTGTGNSEYAALRLDQDAGGGIRAAGRCDLYMGEGDGAEHLAGHQVAEGRLYYLILRE